MEDEDMIPMMDDQDRREHKRYFVKNRVFAVVRSENHKLKHIEKMSNGEIAFAIIKSNPLKMGEIIEISRNGLSFNYIENEAKLADNRELDIVFAEKDFHLSRLPFVPVDDTALSDDEPFNILSMKRMAVQFEELTTQQKRKIEHLLNHYTTGEVSKSKC
ncbi:MAG: hypothetical protein PVJ19_08125 [Desulfobacteraceae bacterium]